MRSSLFAGILCIILGILIYINPSVYGNPVPPATGIVIIVCGIGWIFYSIFFKSKFRANKEKTDDS